MSAHAPLSPSSGHRWIHCPASVRREQAAVQARYLELASARGISTAELEQAIDSGAIPDPFGSGYANEGNRAHDVADYCLRAVKRNPDLAGPLVAQDHCELLADACAAIATQHDADPFEAPERAAILDYVRYCLTLVAGADWWASEHRVHINEQTWGTSDLLAVCGDALHVVDLKFGQGEAVDPIGNEQMMTYAAGALLDIELMFPDIAHVVLHIHQPRIDGAKAWAATADQVRAWAADVLLPAQAATAWPDAVAVPGTKQCRFCRAARAGCPERAEFALSIALEGFEPPAPVPAPDATRPRQAGLLGNDELAELLPLMAYLRAFAKDVDSEAVRRAMAGQDIPGYKLVQGRGGPRKWADPAKADRALQRRGKLAAADRFTKTLITPPQAEKILGKKPFSDMFASLVTQSDGAPTLVLETDKRERITVDPTAGFTPEPGTTDEQDTAQ